MMVKDALAEKSVRKSAYDPTDVLMNDKKVEKMLSLGGVNTTNLESQVRSVARNGTLRDHHDRSDIFLSANFGVNATSSTAIVTKQRSGEENTTLPSTSQKPRSDETGEFAKIWNNVKKMMGFSPDCKNGGHKNSRGNCVCPTYFNGELCENMVCLNGGYVHSSPSSPEMYCRCPHPDFITGKHCELLHCHNGGRDLGNGNCSCVDGWYTGQFCQYYTSSWLIAIGIPLVVVAMLIICCVICHLDFCPRRRTARSSRRQRHYYSTRANSSFPPSSFDHRTGNFSALPNPSLALFREDAAAREQAFLIQQNLLNEQRLRQVSTNSALSQGYVVRLEHIPIFNPQNDHAEDRFKIEPPPSYDQAVLRCPSLNADVPPPNYTALPDAISDNRVTHLDNDNAEGPRPPPPPNRAPPQPPPNR